MKENNLVLRTTLALITLAFILIISIVLRYTGAADVSTSAEIQNTAPTVDTIRFSTSAYGADDLTTSGILPNIGTDRTIHINGQITDLNGENDIASSTLSLVFFRTSKGNTCTADKNDCYTVNTCATTYTDGDDTEISYNCEVPLAYWIDGTDSSSIYESDNWSAYVTVSDVAGLQAASTGTIEMNSLLALNLPDDIDYGTRSLAEVSSSTTNIETILTQRGNTKADVEVLGTTMSCSSLGTLPIDAQAWSLTDTDYASGAALTGSFVPTLRNINLRTDDANELSANLYWNIAIPATGVKGTCTGSNTIVIVAQPNEVATGGTAWEVDTLDGGTGQTLAKFAAGTNHSIAIKTDGTLWAWGENFNGQLGLGTTNLGTTSPAQVSAATNWSQVAAGEYHSLAIKTDGTLWVWGYNNAGQLGLGDTTQRTLPTQLGTATNWSKVIGGLNTTFAIKTDGTLWAWGWNASGGLGVGDTADHIVPTQVGTDTNWSEVTAENNHALAIKTDGTLWAWGINNHSQLGLDDGLNRTSPVQVGTDTNWSKIVGGYYHSFALKTNGTLWAWGWNLSGGLGFGDTDERTVPTQLGTDTNWSRIVGANEHALAVKTNGTLWAWGLNTNGQLGLGDTTDRTSPTQVGTAVDWSKIAAEGNQSFAMKTDSTLWAWGYNDSGQLGLGNFTSQTTPTQLP